MVAKENENIFIAEPTFKRGSRISACCNTKTNLQFLYGLKITENNNEIANCSDIETK